MAPNRTAPYHRFALAFLLVCADALAGSANNWPQFRGPQASGFSADPAPVTWDIKSGENVLWQTQIPGLAHSCPIIWNNKIYLTTAVKPGSQAELRVGLYGDIDSYNETEPEQWRLLCLDRKTGKQLWNKLALEQVPRSQRHTKATHCNSTPATDGKRLVALFGSEGLFCFDMKGRELWHRDLGRQDSGFYVVTNTQWGFGSSPVLYDGKVIVQCDVLSEQYLVVFEAKTGRELWRTRRQDVPTWSTPIVARSPGRTQVIVSGWKQTGGYDFITGRQLWVLNGGGDIPVASPIVTSDLAIFSSAHGRFRPMRAVRLEAAGDITPAEMGATNQAVVWCHPRLGSYLQTPIVVGPRLWSSMDGILSCFDTQSGHVYYTERIGGGAEGFTASPVAAADKLYFTSEQGNVFVIPTTSQFNVLATNSVGGLCLATPAISRGTLYFRTVDKLVAVGFRR